MSDNADTPAGNPRVPASLAEISLSQAILAPLDALFKAQVHAARSFLNLLLQIGYPHVELDKDGNPVKTGSDENSVYTQDFAFNDQDGNHMQVSIPSLALVPIAPLTIENASFKLNFKVENNDVHSQIQASEKNTTDAERSKNTGWDENNRPWYLVKDPVSFRGNVSPPASDRTESSQSSSSIINIEINLCRQPLPSGLDKLLTALQQSSKVTQK
jgi:hypothetical protein